MRKCCFCFRLGSLALICSSFFGTILLRAAVTSSATTSSHQLHDAASSKATVESPRLKMRLSLDQDVLNGVPSCQYFFSQVEVTNLHQSESVTLMSIQATPEETFVTRQNQQQQPTRNKKQDIFASATSSTAWDQRSMPQQIHLTWIEPRNSEHFVLGPGETTVVPVTYIPRYPCTLGMGDQTDLEDYYAQQVPYQIAFSSTFDPDDENFSLAQPPPPILTKFISGTARADWEQLVRDMPPQQRSNWLQQQQQQHQGGSGDSPDHQVSAISDNPPSNDEEWMFQVRTTFLVQTTRGTIQIPVRTSSKRQNAYGLPDVIYFDQEEETGNEKDSQSSTCKSSASPQPSRTAKTSDATPGVLWFDTDMAPAATTTSDGSEGDEPDGLPEDDDDDEISPMTSRDCYNLFVTNPNTTSVMRVLDVKLSHPEKMNLQIQGQLRAPTSSIDQWWNTDGADADANTLGPLVVGPGEHRYVVTVCTAGSSGSAAPPPSHADFWLYGGNNDEEDDKITVSAQAARATARAAMLASTADHSLGFIQIRTDTGKLLFVALERLRKQCRSGSSPSTPRRGRADQFSPQSAPSVAGDQQHKQQAYPPSYHHALYQEQMQPTEDLAAKAEKLSSMPGPTSPLVTSSLKSVPPRLDFSLLSSSSPTITSYIGIDNPKDYPIKIMRSGVAVEIEDEVDSTQPNPEELGLHLSVKIQNSILGANGVTEKALSITCSIRWDRFRAHNLDSLFFHGNAILRATSHVDFNYNQWIRNLVKSNSKTQQGKILITNDYANEPSQSNNNTKQTEFVLEIPLSVSMVQGKIGIMIHRTSHPFPHLWAVQSWKEGLGSVSSIFYPQRAFDIRAELDSGEGPLTEPIFGRGGIDHKLRIFANINIPSRVGNRNDYQPQSLQLATATIEEEKRRKSNGNTEDEDICGRFRVTINSPPSDEFPFEGFNDVGLLHIKYRFPGSESADFDENDDEPQDGAAPAYPTYCRLSFTTEPHTENHHIPLIVYPGQTDISATQTPLRGSKSRRGKYKKKNKKKGDAKTKETTRNANSDDNAAVSSHVVDGFEGLLEWFQTSRIGSSLKSFLEQAGGEQRDWGWNKRNEADDKMLTKYVSSLCRKSLNLRTAHLRPILLKVGAIRHGSIETSSFYMTNHNPIPLLVSVDVGEVEGMSISLARVPTRGQGDGHNILDHFPKKRTTVTTAVGGAYQQIVLSGDYRGHPLEGMRNFLKKSDVAQQFLSEFRFRDAISLSPSAVERQPLLGTLYKKYAFGEFHRDPLPIRFGQDGWSQCRRRRHSRHFVHDNESDGDDNDGHVSLSAEDSARALKSGRGPFMISDDFKKPTPLKVCWDKDAEPMEYPSDGTYTIVPPGAVARFDVKLHAPKQSMLRDDITRFLSTGLVLSTDHGEILPIFVTFEALLGELKIAKTNTSVAAHNLSHRSHGIAGRSNTSFVQVPASLFHESDENQAAKADDTHIGSLTVNQGSVPLRVKSSFSRDVRLVGVSSCNPWFQVKLDDKDGSPPQLPKHSGIGHQRGVDIGVVRSTISCKNGRNPVVSLRFPSFFQCALNWLSNRSELQPRGCGVSPTGDTRSVADDEASMGRVAEQGGIKRALKAFERALLVSRFAFGGSGNAGDNTASLQRWDSRTQVSRRPSGDGFVAPVVLDVFAEAWDAWRVVADYGMRKLSSTLKATIEYESSGPDGKLADVQNLSVSMRDTVVESLLTTPKLFDAKRANASKSVAFASLGDDDTPSVVEFDPTFVADSASLTIPLRNPTSVPVRVRLATAPPRTESNGSEKETTSKSKFSVDEDVRLSFTKADASPFVQRKTLNTTTQHYHAGVMAEQLWWDGAGGYFLADEYGDLIRSHHNIRIMAGAGAHVSLVNPSLHSNVAVLVGCGLRCGVRDDKMPPHMQDANESSKLTSPLGASAAAGITLSGRTRSNMPQVNVRKVEEPLFSAGAATPGKSGGPAAFALPYSALDEIIIPPFGEVEVGPVMFRPPGRYSVHGCQAAADSRAHSPSGSAEKSRGCNSNVYQSMIYIENSMTGLERISLRGRALWDRVIFLDPPPVERLGDDFGNIELRHGRSALMFSGSKASGTTTLEQQQHMPSTTVPGSVIKEVVVHNQGDAAVDFDSVYLSDSARLHTKHSTSTRLGRVEDLCSYKQFRLLNCIDEGPDDGNEILQSVKGGFTLEPGQSISLFVEHFPDCSRQRDFIALNLERRRKPRSAQNSRRLKGKNQSHSFRPRKLELLIGYDMTDAEYGACAPVQRWGYSMSHLHREAKCIAEKRCRENWFSRFNHRMLWYGWGVLGLVLTAAFLTVTYTTIYSGYLFRRQSSDFFVSTLTTRRKAPDNGVADKASNPAGGRSNWSAAFRCLARADPTSSDLQTLGREQVRHVVLGRYRNMGILQPQCLTSNGVFNRERSGVATSGSPARQMSGKDGNVGSNDRARTLSDGLFRSYSTHHDRHMQTSLPCGLAWRAAVARGVKLPSASENAEIKLKSSELVLQRETVGTGEEVPNDDLSAESTSLQQQEESQHSSDGSEPTDDVSDAQYSEEGDDSQLQGSFVSELSEEQQTPEVTDDTSDVVVQPVGKAEVEEVHLEPDEQQEDVTKEADAKPVSVEAPTVPRELPVSTAKPEEERSAEATNGASKVTEKATPAAKVAKETKKEGSKAERKNKERATSPQPQKKKEKPQDKRERRNRQKARGTSPVKTDSTETTASSPQPKQNQAKDTKSKANDSKAPQRQAKGKKDSERSKATTEKVKATSEKTKGGNDKKANAERGKQGGKQNQQREREKKSHVSSPDPKPGKGPEADEKANKRRGNKGDAPGGTKKSNKEGTSKEGNGKSVPNEKKSKNASSKKSKKGKAAKNASAAQTKAQNQHAESAPETTQTKPNEETPARPPVLRPPPGLAPPPGFGQDSATPQSSSIHRSTFDTPLLPPSAFLSDTSLLGTPSSAVLGTPSRPLGDTAFGGLSPTILSGEPTPLAGVNAETPLRGTSSLPSSSHGPAADALLASVANTPLDNTLQTSSHNSAGFDVMDFLDSILNDGNSAPVEASPQRGQSPFLTGGTPVQSLSSTPVPPLSLDPWATERQSRASAYGIAIDDSDASAKPLTSPSLHSLNESVETITPIPLLNPAAILYAVEGQEEEEDDDEDDFYALLGMNTNAMNADRDDDETGGLLE